MIKVLIIEDDTALAKLYETKFTKEGFTVFIANDGPSGVRLSKENAPDIILLDVMLPLMNGFQVLKKIRKNKDTKKIPVIILTNYGEMDNVTEGFLQGATEFMVKVEHTPEEVVDTVTQILETNGSIVGEAFKS
ncbi:TPA: response regulator [candidate division CPR2 bacterium]|uniref:Two component transcriptional regulator, winged helix family, two-component system, OmpR family, response regulator VicR n=1 Tax=candidate division CPR2 bacterium GW2011_GWC1_41_48 TaxID=1618344 RepID=A0A0G0WCS4_UNCC2|nr:MAG: Response regulator receiver domain protein [candidate division CPR2 bacterium GW2011_GWC2_39_35]KKR28874.1 MAG: Response regulator receiver domain protein [candidate division CPR2 bacterium GW2011_GWD1_39_7]KKR29153.1 MAG: Response regulator receiver domain protein [candidate division CPR2 bacterium GW2011_GWD2_39_7]KKS09867.1 MAG: two component transcriptional regulator, winged helix family, two-component system, OmpR family, response regulator VicR [candidate division CPR2 bacterium GW